MPRDADKIVRVGSDSDLTATETKTFTLEGGAYMQRPFTLRVLVPSQAGTTPTLVVKVRALTDGKEIEVTHTENIDASTTFPFDLILPLPPSDDTSWDAVFTVGGTTPDFGAVEAWIDGPALAKVPAA